MHRSLTALVTGTALVGTALLGPVPPAAAAPAPARPAATVPVTATPTGVPSTGARRGAVPYPAAATCVDTVGALGRATCARITAVLAADERASTDEIAVAVLPSTGTATIEAWSTGLFNAWGLGKADRDNGVLLVVAVTDRRLRLVTGDGLRSRLPDGEASEIVGGTITPLLRAGRTRDAVLAGLDAVRRALGHSVTTSTALAAPGSGTVTDPYRFADDEPDSSGNGGVVALLVLVVVGIAVLSWVSSAMRAEGGDDDGSSDPARRRSSFSSSSSSRRSSSSGRRSSSSSRRSGSGGGRSSGGGASGSW